MKLTDALLGEHAVIHALFAHVEKELSDLSSLQGVQSLARALAAALVSHARIEEELLFPALEAQIGPMGPVAVMRHEHHEIDACIDAIAAASNHATALEALHHGLQVARDHFAKEEQILFRMARRAIPDPELEQLGKRWAAARQVVLG